MRYRARFHAALRPKELRSERRRMICKNTRRYAFYVISGGFCSDAAGGGERRLPCPCAARHLNPLSIVVANRLLSRSVIRKIERPLDELLAGAREVASGNLGYRIYEIFR